MAHQRQVVQKDYFDAKGTVVQAVDASNSDSNLWKKQSLDVTGNWRITNLIDNHNVRYMKAKVILESSAEVTATSIVLIILVLAMILFAVFLGVRLYFVGKVLEEIENKSAGNRNGNMNHV